jgi:hypothetical protein
MIGRAGRVPAVRDSLTCSIAFIMFGLTRLKFDMDWISSKKRLSKPNIPPSCSLHVRFGRGFPERQSTTFHFFNREAQSVQAFDDQQRTAQTDCLWNTNVNNGAGDLAESQTSYEGGRR